MPPERRSPDGPTLEQYIETRFNLLSKAIDDALASVVDASKVARIALQAAMEASQVAADLRYQQRFEAQSDALAAAFLSQQTAMQTALKTAQEAVQAALAAADRAVSKAEIAADKRFDALNELRQMLTDTDATFFPRTEAVERFRGTTEKIDANSKRIDGVEARLNVLAGESAGGKRSHDDTKSYIAIGISILGLLAMILINLMK